MSSSIVDSLENESRVVSLLIDAEKEEEVGVGNGELGVVEGVESGGKVITGLAVYIA